MPLGVAGWSQKACPEPVEGVLVLQSAGGWFLSPTMSGVWCVGECCWLDWWGSCMALWYGEAACALRASSQAGFRGASFRRPFGGCSCGRLWVPGGVSLRFPAGVRRGAGVRRASPAPRWRGFGLWLPVGDAPSGSAPRVGDMLRTAYAITAGRGSAPRVGDMAPPVCQISLRTGSAPWAGDMR